MKSEKQMKAAKKAYNQAYYLAHREKALAGARKYYWTHREERLDYRRTYYLAHPEQIKTASKKWARAHPDRVRTFVANWGRRNPERLKAHEQKWVLANPEKIAAKENRRRVRQAKAPGTHTLAARRNKFAQMGNVCFYCHEARPLTVDHGTPIARGGSDYISNIFPACGPCNSSKGNKTVPEFLAWKKKQATQLARRRVSGRDRPSRGSTERR